MKKSGKVSDDIEDKDLLECWDAIEKVVFDEIPQIRAVLSGTWDHHLFSEWTWLRLEVSKRLGVDEENPYHLVREAVEKSWRNVGRDPPREVQPWLERLDDSCGRHITIRFWEPKKGSRRDVW